MKERVGFAINGMPPASHTEPFETLLDEDLKQYETIWAAAAPLLPHCKITGVRSQNPGARMKLMLLGSVDWIEWIEPKRRPDSGF